VIVVLWDVLDFNWLYRFDNGRMIGKGKDYDAFAHLRLFPNMGRSYKYGILE